MAGVRDIQGVILSPAEIPRATERPRQEARPTTPRAPALVVEGGQGGLLSNRSHTELLNIKRLCVNFQFDFRYYGLLKLCAIRPCNVK